MRTALTSALIVLVLALPAQSGPLVPPPGAVASTMKPLSEVEPRTAINAANTPGDADSFFKIVAPGSYYLTENIVGVIGKHGIKIAASGVTFNLNGFELQGTAGMGAFDGVVVGTSGLSNLTVLNGSVRNWGGIGVNLGSSGLAASSCRIEDVVASGNSGHGIALGDGGLIARCTSSRNTGSGIVSSFGSTIADCLTRSNSLDGIMCSGTCVIRNNHCSFNGSGASDGANIHVTAGDCQIEGNNCIGGDRGIDVDFAGNLIVRNTCSGATSNWEIVAGNSVGPIVVAGTNPTAISGNGPAPSTLASGDPNANFTY
jgi:hypothetical protein